MIEEITIIFNGGTALKFDRDNGFYFDYVGEPIYWGGTNYQYRKHFRWILTAWGFSEKSCDELPF